MSNAQHMVALSIQAEDARVLVFFSKFSLELYSSSRFKVGA